MSATVKSASKAKPAAKRLIRPKTAAAKAELDMRRQLSERLKVLRTESEALAISSKELLNRILLSD
jgi:hypothetical protein